MTNTLVKANGKTSDIANAVITTYNKDWQQVCELAQQLKKYSVPATCAAVFDHVIKNVRYIEDPAGVQWVKTPARLMADKSGDCKSMAIFIASCLRCLNIPHVFRFVSFSKRKDATHVYVVARDENGAEIIIDPVVRISGMPKFNYEEKYTYKSDMDGTNIYYMAGIRRANSVGAAESEEIQFVNDDERFRVWLGNSGELTRGKYTLYVKLDLIIEESTVAQTPKELAVCYDNLDIISTLIHGYEEANGNHEGVGNAALQVAGMIGEGLFSSGSPDLDFHAAMLPGLYKELDYRVSVNYDPKKINKEWLAWMQENVVDDIHQSEHISGVLDLLSRKKMTDNWKKSGFHYLYMFIPDSQIRKFKPIIAQKKAAEIRHFNKVNSWDMWHKSGSALDLARAGVIARTGMTPENFIRYAQTKKVNISGVGSVTAVLGVISAILSIFKAIFSLFGKKNDEITEQDIANATSNPGEDLWAGPPDDKKQTDKAAAFNFGGIAPLVIGGALLLMNMNKK